MAEIGIPLAPVKVKCELTAGQAAAVADFLGQTTWPEVLAKMPSEAIARFARSGLDTLHAAIDEARRAGVKLDL
jgi:hypothetical protein